ncbi:carbohydrate ABC transporter substrate-binding protein (CUT1 family) [Haloactinopolyspora alba]|uniref:Carbohydrate ABC transporter substrate-binding protein (CUT1 family) n=1 Tax=Haloactinopolyspora alba TaxID=648780 RepID=A0A2P8E170_9ACTN|nr:ABC transporter substrate-binding protein [Haloactinopolyspora alba]PSL03157.1 carbohydrate ABC transporter substrate-binding protein (CUT1 family) [Haloactinopolyspora alba]
MRIWRHRPGSAMLAAVAALSLFTAACGSDDSEASGGAGGEGEVSGEITLLTPIYEGTDGEKLLEEELLPKFYEQYPDVSVSVDYTTYGTLNEKLTTAVASGLVPDVMMMGVGWIEGFADKGVLRELSEFGITGESLKESYTEQIVQAGMYDGGVYAVPIMLDTRFAVARKDILAEAGFDKPPSSWEELREYAIALTERDADGTLTRAGFDMLSHDLRQMFEVFLFSSGASLFNDDVTEPTFNSPEAVEALQFMTDLINEHKVEDVGFSSTDAQVHPLINGRAAMGLAHNNLWLQVQESAPELADQLVPFLINGEQPGMFFGGTLATVSANSEHPEAAAALLEFLSSPEAALAANEQRGNVPALTELLDSEYVRQNKMVQFAMENLEHAQNEGGPPQWLEIRGEFTPAIEAALLGEKTPQQALDDLAATAQEAMDR